MKEIINIVVIVALLLGGTAALKEFHDIVRKVALEKAAQGLPSLEGMSRALQQPSKPTKRLNHSTRKVDFVTKPARNDSVQGSEERLGK